VTITNVEFQLVRCSQSVVSYGWENICFKICRKSWITNNALRKIFVSNCKISAKETHEMLKLVYSDAAVTMNNVKRLNIQKCISICFVLTKHFYTFRYMKLIIIRIFPIRSLVFGYMTDIVNVNVPSNYNTTGHHKMRN